MREEKEKNQPDQQNKHRFFVHEAVTAASRGPGRIPSSFATLPDRDASGGYLQSVYWSASSSQRPRIFVYLSPLNVATTVEPSKAW